MKINYLNLMLCSAIVAGKLYATVENVSYLPSNIEIKGNQRVETETILSYVPFKSGEAVNDDKLNEILKSLYATGYFTDVKVSKNNGKVIIEVQENPIINRIAYEGNNKLKDDIIEQEIKLRPREVLTKARVQDAQQRMLEIYRRMGRYGASVNPKIIKQEQNRVDLVFEIDEGEVTNIRKIVFIGNKSFKSSTLEEKLKSKRAKWYRFFASDDVYDPDRFIADQQELRKFYYDNGFPDVRIVAANAELSPDQKDFFLTFQIDEGEKYQFGKVDIQTKLPNVKLDALKEVITFNEGDNFSGAHLERTILYMTNVIGSQGYAFVAIEPIVKKDPLTKIATITFEIKEGPRVYIDKIIFKKNDRTRDYVLRREMTIHEGDAYNAEKIKDSEQNLKDLGYFKKVEVETEPGSAPDKANVVATVEEQPTGEIGFSGGYSTLDGPLAQIKFVEKNLMGTGRVLTTDLAIAKRRQDFNVGIVEPYFLGRNLTGSASIFSVRSTRFSFFTHHRLGMNLGISYALSSFWSQSWNYGISLERIKNAFQVISPYLSGQSRSTSLSAITHTIAYDRRNSAYKPTRGYRLALSTAYAGLGGGVQYLQNVLEGGWYYPVAEDVTFMLKGEYGNLKKLKRSIRVADRFMLGANSFRGFEYSEIGPRDMIIDENNNPVNPNVPGNSLGGTQYWTATAELVFPIGLPNEFGVSGAVFTDMGSLWKVGEKTPKIGADGKTYTVMNDQHKIRITAGVGLSWESPFGPISIDYARTIKKSKFDGEQRFLFGFSTRY